MAAVSDLPTLLHRLDPELLPGLFVFCSVPRSQEAAVMAIPPIATFRESEGLSAVVMQTDADTLNLSYESTHRCITLRVHSSLTAVGLTAAVSTALANAGMSANVVAAHHHDHIFVAAESADAALHVLQQLASHER